MSGRWVLDASAAIHLVMRSVEAAPLVEALERAELVIAPSLYCSETANALWKYIKARHIDVEQGVARHEEALNLVDRLVPDCDLALEALALAAETDHPVYDALYAVLARRHACGVLTRDRRLMELLQRLHIPTLA